MPDDARASPRKPDPPTLDDWFALPEGEPMGIDDIRDALVIRHGSIFLLTDAEGNVPAGNARGYGVYHADTRHLSAYNLSLNGAHPVTLLSTAEMGNRMAQVMTNPSFMHDDGRTVPRGSIEMRRHRIIDDGLRESLQITNYNPYPVTMSLLYDLDADFADIFDVRGYERERAGKRAPARCAGAELRYAYRGIDGLLRETLVSFDRKPAYVDDTTVLFRLTLEPRAPLYLQMDIVPSSDGYSRPGAHDSPDEHGHQRATRITTSDGLVDRALQRALDDIEMLGSVDPEGERYPAAGTPWFDALFGRDSAIVAMQMLAFRPEIARSVLRVLARYQGVGFDQFRDEEPGKILHELRTGELSRAGDLPYRPYYGSIDSTPLFLMLAAAYFDWTGDDALMRELRPHIDAALEWIDARIAGSMHGMLCYERQSVRGLVNQGWKDSFDAIMHTDGRLLAAPIALVEVQAYAFAARRCIARVFDALGDPQRARELRDDADAMRKRFDAAFWSEDDQYYALALDRDGAPSRSVASNGGHCLWARTATPEQAEAVAHRLMLPDMFGGWGIRTLSFDAARFNPIGYHTGTVWPHDNSIAAMGLKMYGHERQLHDLARALFDAASAFPYARLPELYGGQKREAHVPPVPYPVACQPQAWAAGSLPLLMQAILGLQGWSAGRTLAVVKPDLPAWLTEVTVRGLRVGKGEVDLHYQRIGNDTHVAVLRKTGDVSVRFEEAWPV